MNVIIECLRAVYPDRDKINTRELAELVQNLVLTNTKRISDKRGDILLADTLIQKTPHIPKKNESLPIKRKMKSTPTAAIAKKRLQSDIKPKKTAAAEQQPTESQIQAQFQYEKLLRLSNEAPIMVTLKAFTGMPIGLADGLRTEDNRILVRKSNGDVMEFDANTLKQINAKNPKYANRIEF